MDFLVVLNINQEVLKINPPSEHLFQPIVVTWLLRHKSVPAFQWSSLNITNNISIKFDPPKPGSLMIPRNKKSFKQCTPKHKNKGCIITMYHLCRMRIHIFHIHNIYKHHLPQPCFFLPFFPHKLCPSWSFLYNTPRLHTWSLEGFFRNLWRMEIHHRGTCLKDFLASYSWFRNPAITTVCI